ncbi:hypothetical protein THRCLA_20647 [Thraustotheca clavata]|uniref:Uncharacterized protein n=1 Tax=Thraustotheca clavata TaxID=74557 RepID=A0A1W0A4Z2_9STRA|nr:hypothetical protein THRCLA_20647 [Thraustotheca clavata]
MSQDVQYCHGYLILEANFRSVFELSKGFIKIVVDENLVKVSFTSKGHFTFSVPAAQSLFKIFFGSLLAGTISIAMYISMFQEGFLGNFRIEMYPHEDHE